MIPLAKKAALTYMSIAEKVAKLVADGVLFHLPSEWFGEDTPRAVYVSAEIYGDVMGPFKDAQDTHFHNDSYRLSQFRAYLDSFSEHGEISVAEDPYSKPSDAMLARVDPVEDEFWDMRSVSPKPGIRALGGFVAQDEFVALTWNFREVLDPPGAWKAEIDRCRAEWVKLFGACKPFSGETLDAYLTNFYPV
jgi:hypothetical protein